MSASLVFITGPSKHSPVHPLLWFLAEVRAFFSVHADRVPLSSSLLEQVLVHAFSEHAKI